MFTTYIFMSSTISFKDFILSLLPSNQQEAFFSCYATPLSKTITLLNHKAESKDIIQSLEQKNRKITISPYLNTHTYTLENTDSSPGQHFLHQGGFFYVQELAAALPAMVLAEEIKENDIILDLCSAPGGKTIQLADALLAQKKKGLVIANEPLNPRRKALMFNINRTGVYNTVVTAYPGEIRGKRYPESVHHVLVDVPCSGEGTGFKKGEIPSRDERKIKNLSKIQYDILLSAIHACKEGGTIVYSTCTLNPIENEMVIKNILATFGDYITLENIEIKNKSEGISIRNGEEVLAKNQASKLARFWPHIHHTGGFFIAKLRKNRSTKHLLKQKNYPEMKKNLFDISQELQKKVETSLQEEFGITTDENYFFIATKNKVYLTSPTYKDIHDTIFIDKTGIPLYDIGHKGNRVPSHHLGNILGHLATKNTYTVSDEQAEKYSKKQDLILEDTKGLKEGFVILKRKNYGFSLGKLLENTIKNKCI